MTIWLTIWQLRVIFVALTNILLLTALVSLVSNSLTEVCLSTIRNFLRRVHRRYNLQNRAADTRPLQRI